jgi:hypothetical protein
MFDYQILCEPDGKTPRALAAPDSSENLVIAAPSQAEARQLWQLEPCIGVDDHSNAIIAFYLVNKETGQVAQAPVNADGTAKPDTQGVTQASKDHPGVFSPVRTWTLDRHGMGFAIRPLGNEHQNLNAWGGDPAVGTPVGIYRWKDGQENEVWGIKAIGA